MAGRLPGPTKSTVVIEYFRTASWRIWMTLISIPYCLNHYLLLNMLMSHKLSHARDVSGSLPYGIWNNRVCCELEPVKVMGRRKWRSNICYFRSPQIYRHHMGLWKPIDKIQSLVLWCAKHTVNFMIKLPPSERRIVGRTCISWIRWGAYNVIVWKSIVVCITREHCAHCTVLAEKKEERGE
jgi:hypothetical protein